MRYRVLDLPVQGNGAFTPLMSTNPIASSWGLVHVSGSPGTTPIQAPKPQNSWLPVPDKAAKTQPSNCAPDIIFPDLYVASARNMGPVADGFGMATRRFTPIPVPAVRYTRIPRNAMSGPHTGGRRAPIWPRAFQRFPSLGKPS